MNKGTLFGIVASLVVFFVVVAMTVSNVKTLLDLHAFILVFGGTMAAALVMFPAEDMMKLLRVFFRRMFGKNRRDYPKLVAEIVNLAKAWRKGKNVFESTINEVKDPFLKDGALALFWLEGDISHDELRHMLETRADIHFEEYSYEAKTFASLGKFPPAFGLMGTTLGLISMLQGLGEGGSAGVGAAMAVALTATLYGLFLANIVFIPIAENLNQQTHEDYIARRMVIEGLMLIPLEKPTKFVEEKVKSYLLPSRREAIKGTGAKGGSSGDMAA